MSESIRIQPLLKLGEMRPAVELQRIYWGQDVESVVPGHMLYSIVNAGGHVLGAYDDERLIGVLIGLVALDPDTSRPIGERLQIASKRMVVLPDYRSKGIGAKLKLAQRQEAIRQGIELVTWTFDPLLSTNAHLNIRKLRAVCRQYLPDYYGTEEGAGLTRFSSSDRLLVEWSVNDPAVKRILDAGQAVQQWADYAAAGVSIINPASRDAAGFPVPTDQAVILADQATVLLEIPPRYDDLTYAQPALTQAWQAHIRVVFLQAFAQGYMVTDFLYMKESGIERSCYVLTRRTQDEAHT
jgi:predicted GNAT superfamily acetyltransferase